MINKTYSKTYSDETKFYTSDTALELNFQLKEVEYDFDSAEIILLNVDDRSLVTRPVGKSADGFTYELEDDIVEHYGEWKGQLKLNEGGEIYVSSPVSFRIENDLNNDRPPQLTDIRDWETLRQNAKDLIAEMGDIVANEAARIEAEKERVEGYQEVRNFIDNFEIGENAVGTENIKDSAVTLEKVSFSKKGKNLFDKTKAVKGYVNNVLGIISSHDTYYASDYMPVDPNSQYTRSSFGRLAFYDANNKFISGLNDLSNYTITTPSNAYFIRHTITTTLDAFQFEKGSVRTDYEKYTALVIGSEYIEKTPIDISKIPEKSIAKEKLDFITIGKNLVDITKSTEGKYVNQLTGQILDNVSYNASEPIPVEAGDKLTISNTQLNVVRYALYDKDNMFLTGALNGSMPLTVTQDGYIRFSYLAEDKPMIEKSDVATAYEPYKLILKGVSFDTVDEPTGQTGVDITLPSKIYGAVGKELAIYFNNVVDVKPTNLNFDITSSAGKQMEDKWEYTPTATGNTALSLTVYKDYNQVSKKDTNIVVADIAKKDLTVLYFGDSTVNAGGVTKRLLDLYSAETSILTLIGTRGLDITNRYEGRGGWGAATYRTPTEIYGEINPFYNPAKSDFDFSYYMTTQGYTTPNHFIIQLGINDVFGYSNDKELNTKIDTILNDFDFIINDVHSYDENIKIGVTVTIPPNNSQNAFGNAYGNGQNQWRYKRNNAIWVKRLIEHFSGKESQGIYLVPMQHNIDTTINIADGVHPTQAGYDQIGDSVYAYLKNIG